MTSHLDIRIGDFPTEDEDREFKHTIETGIDFQRSYYPQQPSASPLTVTSSSPLTISNETVSKKRKKSRQTKLTTSTISLQPNFMKLEGRYRFSNISKLPQLRILKRDIRRRYLEMYYNVLNSHDINLYSRFLHEFCTPNCQGVVLLPSNRRMVRNGIQEMLHDSFANQAMMPDGMIQCTGDAKIYVPLDTAGSRIVASVSFRGTKLFDVPTYHENRLSSSSTSPSSISSSDSDDADSLKSEELPNPQDYPDNSRSTYHLLPRFQNLSLSSAPIPIVINVNAVLTIHLDASNRIERFVVDSLSISSQKVPTNGDM